MANYSLVVGSKFRPLSYEDIVRPLQQATDLQNQYEDAYAELATKADVWKGLANEQTDPTAYRQYTNYANALNEQASILANQGLTPTSRQALNNLRRRYATEITPIEKAYTDRQKDIERQQKIADATGGRTVFSRDARTTSLDKYMKGIDDYRQANLDAIMKEAATGAAGISSRYFNTQEGRAFGNDYYKLTQTQGINPVDAIKILNKQYGDSQHFQDFKDFIEKGLSKYQGYGSQQSLIDNAFMQGINEGIVYKQEERLQDNWRAKTQMQQDFSANEAEKNREFQLNQMAPREILDKEGKSTGHYYDPKIGMIVDDKGAIVGDQSGTIHKIGPGSSKEPTEKPVKVNDRGTTTTDLAKVTDVKKMKELGFTPVMAVSKHRGQWQWGQEGDDVGGDIFGGNTGYLSSEGPINTGKGSGRYGGKTTLFGLTESNLSTKWGNYTYSPKNANVSWVSDEQFAALPEDELIAIQAAAQQAGVQEGENYQVLRVKSTPSTLFGRSKAHDEYIIFRESDKIY